MTEDLRALIASARRARDPGLLAGHIPYARMMGISAEMREDGLVGVMRFADHLIGNHALRALHGGATGALLETTAILELLFASEPLVLPRTINLTVDYLRSGQAEDTFARAEITRLGRRVAHVLVRAYQGEALDRLIAVARGNFALSAVESGAA